LKYLKPLSVLISQFWLFIYLILNTKKGENLIVYHSLWLMYPLYVAKKIKKFKLILEVEEIYQDARKVSKINSLLEHKTINLADKYIFPTSLLNDKINSQSKGHTILYGTYKIEERRVSNFSDGKIHIVYAGTFDPNKGGVQTAIEIAPHLSNNYHLHIMGFGSSSQLKETIKQITKTSELSECEITYEGELKGKEYVSFLQKCHIGLSTQRPDADFNKTSFPSKVFSYLVNGLRVVSIKLEVLSLSPVDSIIYYSQSSSSESLAKAIMSIDVTERYNSSKLINMLDNKFEKELEDLIGIING
ncbi:glycosyltransferase, partial [Planomicrobium sp. MB-3u-38]|uniref:glycosyltransferase n=1 Tax=Planomicrobium sp. MB-3u-38 TaxID=2058318 RepID=UPI000CAFCA78